MFSFFKKSLQKGQKITLGITGMHCVSCAMNIDGELEELDGVISATTNYAKSSTTIDFDPLKVTQDEIVGKITELGYTTKVV